MNATIELNVPAFEARLRKMGLTEAAAARRLGVARSTLYRMRLRQMGMSGEFIATVLATLARPRQSPASCFGELFVLVTKE